MNPRAILLIHPLGFSAEQLAADITRKANIMPPLGLASIAAWLEVKGCSSWIIDFYARPDSLQRMESLLRNEQPAWIGFSCTTASFLDGVDLARHAKTIISEIRVIFGGPHVSALKEKLLEDYSEIDFLVIGEGEECLREVMEHGLEHPHAIPGLVFRDTEGAARYTGPRKNLLDLDTLPLPAYDKLDGYPELYHLPIFNYPKAPNTSLISSRGCPYACSYCDRSVFGRSFRFNSAGYLHRHVTFLQQRYNIRHINFYDDQFTFNRSRVEEFCRLLIEDGSGLTFNCAVRADHVDEPLLRQMKRAGCWMISLGIETGDEELLHRHKHNGNLALLSRTIHQAHRAGIRVKGLMMIGLPGESECSVKKSMDFVFSHPIDDINLAKFTPFPGSPLYENIHQFGSFDENWRKMDCMHFLFIPHGMTKERLDSLFADYYRAHYARPSVLLSYIAMLWKSPHSWIRFIKNARYFFSFVRNTEHGIENGELRGRMT